ncbi:hypothetical protein GGX14DRAFT_542575 [Mycena pura]|uniref:Uncharacterized protein n=1 Tax=Mycena pura TaxID=153505 RepID=A0AAD6YEQ9_9AGAR|nr:hypothetical protein GGX14DRAFT_542575 [Mycena pura]
MAITTFKPVLDKGQHFREKRNRTRFFNLAEGRGTNQPPILTMPGTGWGHSQIFFAEYTTLSQRVWTQIMAALQRFARPAPDERYALQDSNFSEHQRCAKGNILFGSPDSQRNPGRGKSFYLEARILGVSIV